MTSLDGKISVKATPPNNAVVNLPHLLSKFSGGTVVGMTLKQYQNPERSSRDNHRYSLITSAWLGGLMMGMGFLASEGINMEIDNPIRTGVFASGAVLSGFIIRKLKKVFFKEKNDQQE